MLLVAVYVDDLLVAGVDYKAVLTIKQKLSERFKMHDLGLLDHFLGIQVMQEPGRLWIGQSTYVNQIRILMEWRSSKLAEPKTEMCGSLNS